MSTETRTRHGYTPADWKQFAKNLRRLDIEDELREFDKDKIENSPNYCARRFNPRAGKTWTDVDASWSCSGDEYYSHRGPASTLTLDSGSTETPGPNDGYEWKPSETGSWWGNNDNGRYFNVSDIDYNVRNLKGYKDLPEGADLEEFIKSLGYYRFRVNSTPIDPIDYYDEARKLEQDLDSLANQCDKIAEELENEV